MSSSDLHSAAHLGQQGQCCLQVDPASALGSDEVSGSLELLELSPKIPQVCGSFQQALEECFCPLQSPNADLM